MNNLIIEEIRKLLAQNPESPRIAAFDADGTLWNMDAGEAFFEFQIQSKALDLPADPWAHYEGLKKSQPPTAYLWLAQINAGQKISAVQNWAESVAAASEPLPFLDAQVRLIQTLQELNFQIYIVTASVKWAVEPGARRLGIPTENVLGIKTVIQGDTVTDQADGPITYREGKAQALLQATGGIRPLFCSGNTLGDEHLLKSSAGVRLAVVSQKPGQPIHDTEMALQNLAKSEGWLTADYSNG